MVRRESHLCDEHCSTLGNHILNESGSESYQSGRADEWIVFKVDLFGGGFHKIACRCRFGPEGLARQMRFPLYRPARCFALATKPRNLRRRFVMLRLALVFLLIAIVAGLLGFTGVAF